MPKASRQEVANPSGYKLTSIAVETDRIAGERRDDAIGHLAQDGCGERFRGHA